MRIGLVGAGLQGKRRMEAIKRLGKNSMVVVADADKDAARRLAKETGCETTENWRDVVQRRDVDVVVVCTPPHLHAPISLAALTKGKHVLCEKPLGRTPEEAKRIVDAARRSGAKLKCGFNLRFHPGIRTARDWCDRGALGELDFIRCRYGIAGRPGYEKEWRAKAEIAGGGELMDQGIHAIDLFRWFLGDFSHVVGFLSTRFWKVKPLEDNVFALLRTSKGQIASLHASWTQWKNLFSLEIYGRDGYATVEGLGGSYGTEKVTLGKRPRASEPFTEKVVDFRGEDVSWLAEWKEFIASIKENREPLGNGYDGWQAVKIAHEIYRSARNGRIIKVRT